ncbi:mitochondrial protein with role in iron accumulation [Metschnikowia bicuspidata var. bicuspidata NRRL YB-4993]|uniref:Mitochondrial protein with role in iron accumulation n=1 Tax=Metschnikowia bicuspidata var. bicuspidata NRRL YB-4993 TaxID=869754 RepID=A0A1A0H7T2_9ASCO|nr:mitochondrial protein with role in iron accumulation [Metschnikowia bicuspidata var. bicuspidata NRRL YB-4993]OBA19958.1 mitochondrial protein with role in iron accumulation [Metschnikowia bicuspidata var. bicuspidata NRRL YB-4993]
MASGSKLPKQSAGVSGVGKQAPTQSTQGHSHTHEDRHDDTGNLHSHDHKSLFHTHTHSNHHNELLGKGFLTNPAVRITWIGLVVNVVMAGSKAVGGVYFHSQALIADAIHSVSDMVADFLTLATVNVALKEGSYTKYPLGYGKLESLGTFAVAGVLLFAGFTVGWSSLLQIFEIFLPSHIYEQLLVLQVHSHSHSLGPDIPADHSHSHASVGLSERVAPNINAAWIALASIGVKEILYRKTMSVAHQTNSKILVANAWHHRVDSLTAGVAFITVTSGVLLGWSWLDAVGGLVVSALIMKAGSGSLKVAWYELIDRGSDPKSEDYTQIRLIVDTEVKNVSQAMKTGFQLTDFSVLTAGARTNLILKLTTDKDIALAAINDLEHDLVAGIREKDKTVGKVFVEYSLNDDKHT